MMTAITRVAPDQFSFFFSSPRVCFRVECRALVFIVLRKILLRSSTLFPLRSSLALGTKKTKYAPTQQPWSEIYRVLPTLNTSWSGTTIYREGQLTATSAINPPRRIWATRKWPLTAPAPLYITRVAKILVCLWPRSERANFFCVLRGIEGGAVNGHSHGHSQFSCSTQKITATAMPCHAMHIAMRITAPWHAMPWAP